VRRVLVYVYHTGPCHLRRALLTISCFVWTPPRTVLLLKLPYMARGCSLTLPGAGGGSSVAVHSLGRATTWVPLWCGRLRRGGGCFGDPCLWHALALHG